MEVSDKDFEKIVSEAIDFIPQKYLKKLENVAFIIEEEPSLEQRLRLNLKPYQSLFGLYEGTPLPTRQGQTKMLPDKITLFKGPLKYSSHDRQELIDRVRHTVWHEVAHYFGLDHKRINELDKKIDSH